MLDLNQVKNAKKTSDDAYDTGIGTSFSAETNRRDEDAEMYLCFLFFLYWYNIIRYNVTQFRTLPHIQVCLLALAYQAHSNLLT